MIHQLKKAWPNAGTIWKAGVPLVAVAMAALKKRNIHLPWPVEGNEACLDTWPPETNCVVDLLPIGLVCLSIILAVNLASFLMETPNESAQKNIQIQHERRHTNIEEMVAEVEGSEDWESNEIGQVQFKKLHHALIDLVELPAFDKTTLERGVQCGWAMFEKELRIGIDKTKEDRDVEYAGGDKLNKLVSSYDDFYALARREGLVQEKADRKRLWKLVKEGRHTVRCVERKGVHKALQLLWLVRKSLGWLVLETLAAMLSAIMTALSVYYRAEVLDTIQVGGEAFWLATRAMVLVQLTASLLNLVTKTLESRGRGKVAHDVKVKYFEALIRRDLDWWATMAKEGKDPSWSIWELDTQVKAFLEIPQSFSENLSTLITHSLLVLRTSSRSFYLLLFLNFGSPLLLWLLAKLTNKLRPILMRGLVLPHYDLETWMYAVDPQYVATFQSFGRSKKECLSFKENDRSWLTYQKRECLLDVMEDPIAAFLSASLDATQIHISGQLISSGQARLPEAQVLMKSSEEVSETVEVSWSLFKGIVEKAQPLAKVYDLCTLPTTINPDAGIYPTQKTRGKIEFKNVKFSYPGRKVPVLKGINFDVRPGQTVGITGKAGCGKSTVMRLLERFYDVSEGQILLDGIDVREYNPEWLRQQIVAVSQEPNLIPTTIRENIAFGCPHEPTLEEIYDACRVANIYDTLMDKNRFPQGLRTEVSRVANISGGEKARIAIARAVLADCPILLLDEATASLDEENQAEVQDALNRLQEGRTTLVIAHRLSTIRKADTIITFDQGKIAETGTHEELLSRDDSIYAKLWNRQIEPNFTSPGPKLGTNSNPQEDLDISANDDREKTRRNK